MDLFEEILNRNNLNKAYKKVKANKGVSGVDGITVEESDYLKGNKDRIINQIRKLSINLDCRIEKINYVVRGEVNYFRIANMKGKLDKIDEHLRVIIRKQWKKIRRKCIFFVIILQKSIHCFIFLI